MSRDSFDGINPKRVIILVIALLSAVLSPFVAMNTIEKVDANEIVVIQYPRGGIEVATTPGIYPQWFGKLTSYPKRSVYEFKCDEKQMVTVKDKDGKERQEEGCVPEKDHRIKVRFNDGGHADMEGSIQYEMPLDPKNLIELYSKFSTAEAVQKQLIETVVGKSIYFAGPLMSSKESYAEKRNSLITYVADQVQNGVYQTHQKEAHTKDPITGEEKSVTIVEIVMGKDGRPERQEPPQLTAFGIKPFNFSISELDYETRVEDQIRQQQQLSMDVQTAMAEAKKAEQRAITTTEQGKADAAQAKWKQEVEKATEVTAAEKRRAVAELDLKTADLRRQEQVLLGEGEAKRRQLVMSADGALDAKLKAYIETQKFWSDAFSKAQGQWVPSVQLGNGSGSGSAQGLDFMQIMAAKAARDLGVDLQGLRGSNGAAAGPAVVKK